MKILKLSFIALLVSFMSNLSAQKIKVISGDLSSLKGIEKVNAKYDYNNVSIGKFKLEKDYVDKRRDEINKDEAGEGDKWADDWYKEQQTRYPKKFEELFNNYSETIKIDSASSSDVLMIVKTTFIEPGFNVGVARKPSLVDMTVSFNKGETVLCSITITGSPGNGAMGYDFDAGFRIGESYAKAGKELGQLLSKKVK